jgi:hypothetical protein
MTTIKGGGENDTYHSRYLYDSYVVGRIMGE